MVDRVFSVRGSRSPMDPPEYNDLAIGDGAVPGSSVIEGHIYDNLGRAWYATRLGGSDLATQGKLGSVPRARAVCVPYDDAGVDFPAGSVQLIAGAPLGRGLISEQFTTARTAVTSKRHWLHPTLTITGLPAATTGTVTITRTADWKLGLVDAATLYTIPVDGANGAYQQIEVAELISAPAASSPDGSSFAGLNFAIYVTAVWTGTAPFRSFLIANPAHLISAPVVPDTIPADFTARVSGDHEHSADVWPQNITTPENPFASRLGEWSPRNTCFTSRFTGGSPSVQRFGDGFRSPRATLGYPDWMRDSNGSPTPLEWVDLPRPRAWIGGDLVQLDYFPNSIGSMTWVMPAPIALAYFADYSPTYDSGVVNVARGPGFRNIRFWLYNIVEHGTPSTLTATITIAVDGVTVGVIDFSAGVVGDYFDLADIYPATRTFNALVTYRIEITGTGSGMAWEKFFYFTAQISPRIDIPTPTHALGPGPTEAPGGYLASHTSAPVPLGGVLHVDAGVSSQSWTLGSGSDTCARLISFVPPTTGLWRIETPNGLASVTLGEYEFRFAGTVACVGRANKRFFAIAYGFPSNLNGTWTLSAVTRTPVAIAAGGTVIAAGDLSPANGYLFGEITIPSSGRYRVWCRITPAIGGTGQTLEVALSTSDPYCVETIDASATFLGEPFVGPVAVLSASSPPASPADGTMRWITAPATGAWVGHEGSLAAWTASLQQWTYRVPGPTTKGIIRLDGVSCHWSGTAWVASTASRTLECETDVAAAGTLYVRVNRWDPEFVSLNPLDPRNGSLTIGWEAV